MSFSNHPPQTTNKQRGNHYENQAAEFLKQQGIQIIEQNFYCKGGEIDLIGLERTTLIFFEVKFRKTNQHGDPSEFINPKKLQRLYRCAQTFIQKNQGYATKEMRFDCICITHSPQKQAWLKNIYNGW